MGFRMQDTNLYWTSSSTMTAKKLSPQAYNQDSQSHAAQKLVPLVE